MRNAIVVAAASALVTLGGCGGDEESNPSGAPVETVAVTETDYRIDPTNPEVGKAGVVAFAVRNRGATEHSLEIEGPKGEAKLKEALGPGEAATFEVNLDRPGRYKWYCPIGDHEERGMVGEITVGGGGASGSNGPQTETESPGGSPY